MATKYGVSQMQYSDEVLLKSAISVNQSNSDFLKWLI